MLENNSLFERIVNQGRVSVHLDTSRLVFVINRGEDQSLWKVMAANVIFR